MLHTCILYYHGSKQTAGQEEIHTFLVFVMQKAKYIYIQPLARKKTSAKSSHANIAKRMVFVRGGDLSDEVPAALNTEASAFIALHACMGECAQSPFHRACLGQTNPKWR